MAENQSEWQQNTRYTKRSAIITTGVCRPRCVNSKNKQVVLLLRDASLSMEGKKAKEASEACRDFVDELAQPINKDAFKVAIIDFSKNAKLVHEIQSAAELIKKISPILVDEYTNITDALKLAVTALEAQEHIQKTDINFLKPVVILFTDGNHNIGDEPYDIAGLLKTKADLVAVAFGTDADEELLTEIASSPQHFYRCRNGRELRMFLADVGKTITMTMHAGINASQALGQIYSQSACKEQQ